MKSFHLLLVCFLLCSLRDVIVSWMIVRRFNLYVLFPFSINEFLELITFILEWFIFMGSSSYREEGPTTIYHTMDDVSCSGFQRTLRVAATDIHFFFNLNKKDAFRRKGRDHKIKYSKSFDRQYIEVLIQFLINSVFTCS